MTDEMIECETHGKTPPAFVCEHLLGSEGSGFNLGYTGDDATDLYPDAWCDDCETAFQKHGEWNDDNEPNISLICAYCYMDSARKNWKDDESVFVDLVTKSHNAVSERQNTFLSDNGINDCERYDYDDETGILTFSKTGKVHVECKYDVVGTFSETSNTWMWAWGNTSLSEQIRKNSLRIRELGHELGIRKLSMGHWRADETDGWEMTSIMGEHLGAVGVYRTKHEDIMRFMVIREVGPQKKKRFGIF